ncbi:MAG: protease [Candidatus Hadarchaeum yellowstonense]|jgi:heat shock protein HtpX|uniref:Protease HtpX homolog n=1 Tax=Hadarchaeum yellowstonense TaxID=1776334 RepID=A0A147JWA7_HADYE|nr:MAG: protease [Candidatus Hadarchaeum yellowstonense]
MSGMARTALLMGILTAMLLLVGAAASYLTGIPMAQSLGFFVILSIIMNLAMYWYADKWVLSIYRARLVSEDEQPKLHAMVSRLAENAGLPKPKVAIVPVDVPNAFATGRSPSHSVVAVTKGAMELLDDEELEGVLGHELSHIKNRDMLVNTMAAIIGAVITYVTYFAMFGGRRDRDSGASLLVILALVTVPFAAMLVRLSISRGREYAADEDGAKISRKPLALASALRKLEIAAKNRPLRQGNPSTAHMFIVNPFRGVNIASLFSTHPPTEQRIARLENLARTMQF